ncbi:bifunctional diguanylate cyclase/phosphodiesterase [Shewanella sp. HL-SH8]|uniref:bifunctional diguanylate cyclase/phosphodiesterase n=1 Tax=Shewanella sp. HL-SH8 TaxID=3436242 RepID=UPI003EBE7640
MFRKGISLRAQLYLLIACLSLFSFGASLFNNVSNMRSYLNEQLASHAQGAAISLGLSISPYMDEEGMVIAATMTNAIFDSGYYQRISFTDINGDVKFERLNKQGNFNVPNWFMAILPLTPPLMISEVSNGWNIAGTLEVQSHAGTSYKTLWDHSVNALTTTLIQFFIALLFAYLIIKSVLAPLKRIELQAEAVIEKRFDLNPIKPFTTELNTVVNAINKMVTNIQRSFSEQTLNAEKLSKEVYIDSHTGLPNRRALMKAFDSLKHEAEKNGNRLYFGMVSLTSLQLINDTEGYAHGDAYITEGATILADQVSVYNDVSLYRVSGSEFAILSQTTHDLVSILDGKIGDAFSVANTNRFSQGFAKHALTSVEYSETFSDAAQRLDSQLTHDSYLDSPVTGLTTSTPTATHSREEWVAILKQFTEYFNAEIVHTKPKDFAIKCIPLDKLFDLMLQPVVDTSNQLLYVECFVRFKHNNETLSTIDVFAMAERLGLLQELEQTVICFIFYKLHHVKNTRVAINISNHALHNTRFTEWLFDTYKQLQSKLPPLLCEFNESGAMLSLESTKQFISQSKALNIEIAIERFGSSLSSFQYIKNLNVDYIKIDGSYIRDIEQADTQFFIQTITQICHGIGIKMIAPQIETLAISQQCVQLNIDGLQGNGLYSVRNFNTLLRVSADTIETELKLNDF